VTQAQVWTIWRISDGKPGHDNQSIGLINAIAKRVKVNVVELTPLKCSKFILSFLSTRFCPNFDSVKIAGHYSQADVPPDLCIAAGHQTHGTLLAVKRCFGAKAILLMKPSLPLSWFDLCFVPMHDRPSQSDHCIQTQGVLNKIEFSEQKQKDQGLILLGGKSKHFIWSNDQVIEQITQIIKNFSIDKENQVNWTLVASRRTPAELINRLELVQRNAASQSAIIKIILPDQVNSDWLPQELKRAAYVWVSQDSVSMVYEALSSGAACGLLELKAKNDGRLVFGIRHLVESNKITTFSQWKKGSSLKVAAPVFYEADRCAQEVIKRCLQ